MAGSDGAILLTTARWSSSGSGGNGGSHHQSDESSPVYLHDVVKSNELPQLVRIVKGSYLGLGAPSLPNPSLSSTALVASAGTSLRLAVQCLKFKDNHKTVNVGPKLAIPESFDGYFEILNEDGRAVRGIESVAELARKSPDSCLLRQNIKVFYRQQSTDKSAAANGAITSVNTSHITERSRTLLSGELLVLVGQVDVNGAPLHHHHHHHHPTAGGGGGGGGTSVGFLRCLDCRGDDVYLPMDMRAKFSAVAKEDNHQGISGVHRIRALLNKRLPLTVRMVSGQPPVGLKIGQQFCYEMRLLASFSEEMIVAMPLGGNPSKTNSSGGANGSGSGIGNDVVIIPPTVSLKLQLPVNRTSLKQSKEFVRMTERCLHQYGLLSDRIQVYDAHFSKNLRFDGQHWRVPVPLLLAPLRRSTSDLIHSITGKKDHPPTTSQAPIAPPPEQQQHSNAVDRPEEVPEEAVPVEYDEIDQIYDYIRGFAPLPKNLKSSSSSSAYDALNESASSDRNNKKSEQRHNLYNKAVSSGHHHHRSTNNLYSTSHHHQHHSSSNNNNNNSSSKHSNNVKPVPPPLDTIPTSSHRNRISNHKESLSNHVGNSPLAEAENHYVITNSSMMMMMNRTCSSPEPAAQPPPLATAAATATAVTKPRMYRQRSAINSGLGATRLYSKNPSVVVHRTPAVMMMSPAESKQSLTPSPLFNIRYKSMTNLLNVGTSATTNTSAADSDTLGSSQSGGRCSGGSAGSAAVRAPHHVTAHRQYVRQIPSASSSAAPVQQHHQSQSQHRLFQLHRPRSLTDLLWGRSSGGDSSSRLNHRNGFASKSPIKIQLHPTVVADVIPSSSSNRATAKQQAASRRRHSGSNHHLLNAGNGSSSNSTTKKHTIFYHL